LAVLAYAVLVVLVLDAVNLISSGAL